MTGVGAVGTVKDPLVLVAIQTKVVTFETVVIS
jgi:hypothetical protein